MHRGAQWVAHTWRGLPCVRRLTAYIANSAMYAPPAFRDAPHSPCWGGGLLAVAQLPFFEVAAVRPLRMEKPQDLKSESCATCFSVAHPSAKMRRRRQCGKLYSGAAGASG